MTIKKVTVKFDNCMDCPIERYTGCSYCGERGKIPENCTLGESTMMNRYTDIKSPANGGACNLRVGAIVDTVESGIDEITEKNMMR